MKNLRNEGERIAQLLFAKVPDVDIIEVEFDRLGETSRGDGGFGSSGRF